MLSGLGFEPGGLGGPLDQVAARNFEFGWAELHLASVELDFGDVDFRKIAHRGERRCDLRETLITLAPYAGYPRVAGLVGECEGVIDKWNKEQQEPPTH